MLVSLGRGMAAVPAAPAAAGLMTENGAPLAAESGAVLAVEAPLPLPLTPPPIIPE